MNTVFDNFLLSIEDTFDFGNLFLYILYSSIEVNDCLSHIVDSTGATSSYLSCWRSGEIHWLRNLGGGTSNISILELHLLAINLFQSLFVSTVAVSSTSTLHNETRTVRWNASTIHNLLTLRHLLDAIEVSCGLRILLTVSRLFKRDLPLTNVCLLLIHLLRRIIDNQLFRNVFS